MRISVDGNIGSGKSVALAALAAAFPLVPCFPEPVDEWADLLKMYYASPSEWALAFALKVLLSFRKPAQVATCLVERSPLASRHVFSQLLYNEGVLACHEWDLFKEYHDVLAWKPDVILFIDTPAEVCMHRVRKRGRGGEETIDLDYLRRVEFQYATMLRYSQVPVVRIDGTLPMDQVHAAVVQETARRLAS